MGEIVSGAGQPEHQGNGSAVADATELFLMARIVVLEELVRWLSITYGDNEPIFAGADGRGTYDGMPLGNAAQLHALWHQCVGRPHVDGPTADAVMVKCEACNQFHVWRPDPT